MRLIFLSFMMLALAYVADAQNIQRFEYFGSESGLSQNSAYSMMCDRKGFLWVGTMNGLNRYDGVSFKVFSSQAGDGKSVANSRIEEIWQDEADYIWTRTYDGCYQYFDQRREVFGTLPVQSSESIEQATSFVQYASDLVFVGAERSGLYYMVLDENTQRYAVGNVPTPSVRGLFVDSRRNLWVLTSEGLICLDNKDIEARNFDGIEIKHENVTFTQLAVEMSNTVIFGTENNGLLRYNLGTETYAFMQNFQQLRGRDITHLMVAPTGHLLVAVDGGHLYDLDENLLQISEIAYHGQGVNDVDKLYLDKYRQLWITTLRPGVTRFSLASGSTRFYQLVPQHMQAGIDLERPFFYEDRHNNFWIGIHGGGLLKYDRIEDSFVSYRNNINDRSSIASNIVHCIVEDHSGQLWLGTGQYRGGLIKVIAEDRAFRNFTPDPNSPTQGDNVVRCLFEDPAHNLWVSTKSGKLYVYDEFYRPLRVFDGLPTTDGSTVRSITYSILIDREGYLWICTKGAGVFVSTTRLDVAHVAKQNLVFTHYTAAPSGREGSEGAVLSDDNTYSIVQDGYDNIWVCTYGNGLSRIKRNGNGVEIKTFGRENTNILSDKVRYLYIDSQRNLWAATTNGVCRVDGSKLNDDTLTFEHFVNSGDDNSLSYNDVCHIYEDTKGTLYFSTIGGGLNSLTYDENGSPIFRCYTSSDGLCNNAVYGAVEDNGGYIWISTENGISRMEPKNETFESFNVNTGLSFNSFSEATIAKLHNGKIVFGGYMGFITALPLQIATSPYKGELELTSLQLANREQQIADDSPLSQSIGYTEQIELKYSQANISIGYRSLDLLDPANTRYAYILEGLETQWNYVGNLDRATYTNLPAGEYVFRVKCTFRNGQWSDTTRDLKIIVQAPWWKTAPAFTFYAVVMVALILFIIKFYTNIHQFRSELTVEKRLNDVKLQFFTNIAHEIRTPLTLIVAPLESLMNSDYEMVPSVQAKMMMIQRNTNRILMLVNQLLDFRKVQNKKMRLKVSETNMEDLVTQVGDNFRPLAEHKNIDYVINIQPDTKPVWIDSAEIDTVVYNLLSNAFKFTDNGKKITLSLAQDEAYTSIIVSDEGRGIADVNPEILFKRYTILSENELSGTGIGLSLAYELVHLHGGDIHVESEVGRGTTFTVRLLNNREHFENNPMITFGSQHITRHVTNKKVYVDEVREAETAVETGRPKRTILIVEDNPEILNYLCQSLADTFECVRASNGQEGLLAVKKSNPELIITDMMMPVMDGPEMIRQLRDDVATSHIPIVALTAKVSLAEQAEIYSMGVDGYISKPFSVEQVKALAENLLEKRKQILEHLVSRPNIQIDDAQNGDDYKADNQDINVNIPSKDKEFIQQLVKYTEENYKRDLSIDEFADHFHMSRTVFYNKVRSLTGSSPLDFVRQIKFRIAELLLKKGFNVSEVAFEIGYSDVKYFSKQFRNQFGYTPSQVKKILPE